MCGATPTILFVGDACDLRQQPWIDRLEQGGFQVERACDVYLALARLGRSTVNAAAVIVCVDSLEPSEFEFFELVSRYHRPTVAYACGRPGAEDQCQAALLAGAREVLTAERFESFLLELRQDLEEADVSAEEPEEAIPEEEVDEASPSTPSPEPVRVPWHKRADSPARTPPSCRHLTPPKPIEEPTDVIRENAMGSDEEEADFFDGPLLSAEELELLMSDDFRTHSARPGENEEDVD